MYVDAILGARAAVTKFEIPSLNGIRALAFLTVFLSHNQLGKSVPGQFGVTVFFFLSGYLITTLLRREYELNNTISFKNFYLRRSLRILPPMFLTIFFAISLYVVGVFTGGINPLGLLSLFGLFANYIQIFYPDVHLLPGTDVFWSLAVEEHFYLIFPAVFYIGMRYFNRNKLSLFLAFCCVLILIWRIILVVYHDASSSRVLFATDTRFDSLLFGSILALYKNPYMDKINWGTNRQTALLWFGVIVILFGFLDREEFFRNTWRFTLQGVGLTALFTIVILRKDWIVYYLLNNPVADYLGNLSYTLYLVHHIILNAIDPYFDVVMKGILGIVLSFAYASLMWHFVEKPCANLRRRLLYNRI